jgi:DNA-binding LacI/PurR family transcriptional regulator
MLRLDSKPTAIILIYELMAIGLYRRLNEAGITPGRDLAVIGFREEPRGKFLQPSLTCFRMSLRDLGVELAETLLATMPAYAEHYPKGARNTIWPLELVPGESDAFSLNR